MEIKLNFEGMKKAVDTYDIYDDELNSIKEDLVDIITDVDDYWIGRCGNSFKYICWYLKLLLDMVLCQDLVQIKMRGSTG